MMSRLVKSTPFGVLVALGAVALMLGLDRLKDLAGLDAVFYSLAVLVLLGGLQGLVVWHATRYEQEKRLNTQIKLMEASLATAATFRQMQEANKVITTERLRQGERQHQEVWVAIEDLMVFEDDLELLNFDRDEIKSGKKYVFFVSDVRDSSVRWFVSRLTGKPPQHGQQRPKRVEVGKGTVEFVYVNPQVFFFFTPITVWSPYGEPGEGRQVLWDFPRLPGHRPEHHVLVPRDVGNAIFDRLESLYNEALGSES